MKPHPTPRLAFVLCCAGSLCAVPRIATAEATQTAADSVAAPRVDAAADSVAAPRVDAAADSVAAAADASQGAGAQGSAEAGASAGIYVGGDPNYGAGVGATAEASMGTNVETKTPTAADPLPIHEAPDIAGAPSKPAEVASGASMGFFGAQTSVWRPAHAGLTNGYDVVIHSEWISRRKHFVGRHRMTGALGGGSGGLEGQFQWITAIGAGILTADAGLAYARLGFDWRLAGNSDVRANLLAPLLEIGHLWALGKYHVDVGARLDTALLGGIRVMGTSDRFAHRLDFGGYTSVHAGPVLVDVALQWRRLRDAPVGVVQVEGGLCGGALVLACTRVSDYWLDELDRHVTQLTFSLGVGYLVHGK